MEQEYSPVKINGKNFDLPKGISILKACEKVGIEIPTLCFLEGIAETGSCGLCVVEVKNAPNLVRACVSKISPGMEIYTDTELVKNARRLNLELILSRHPLDCMTCDADGSCALQDLAYKMKVKVSRFLKPDYVFQRPKETSWDTNPFIFFDPQKCVLCGRCVEACKNQTVVSAISIAFRSHFSRVSTPFDLPLEGTDCQFCAACVQACPVGALMEKPRLGKGKEYQLRKTDTICAYCGLDCGLSLFTDKNDNIVFARGRTDTAVNEGRLCVKGRFGFEYAQSPERLKTPLIKENGSFREASWGEAIQLVSSKLNHIKNLHGPQAIGFLASSRCLNEDNYVLQRFARSVIGTNNIDNCGRLCHSPTLVGLGKAFGTGAATNPINDVKLTELIFVIGSNTTETHPVLGQIIKENKEEREAFLIVCDPRKIDLARKADIHIQHNPGTDVALLNGIMNVIVNKGLHNLSFIENYTEGFEEFLKTIGKYDLKTVSRITGVDPEQIERAAEAFASANSAMIFYTMGITQHSFGTSNVLSVANLALLCGHIGKPGSGVMPLRGQVNVQGAFDMGCLPNLYPGYKRFDDQENHSRLESLWGTFIPQTPGLTLPEMIDEAANGRLKALYVMGENPMMTEANLSHVERALNNLEFLVVQDIFLNETAELADVVLPSACFYEKNGTVTNTERRVQIVRQARQKPEGVMFDWEIFVNLSKAFGNPLPFSNEREIFEELSRAIPQYSGISFNRLGPDGIQWPCPAPDHPGTPILYVNGGFLTPSKKGQFTPVDFKLSGELPDEDYPFLLSTGRLLFHYHSGNETRRVSTLSSFVPENYLEISPEDAQVLGIKDGERVRVSTRRGSIELKAQISERPKKGMVFSTFHFREANVNYLTNPQRDPQAKIPEFKVAACKIEKIS
ncbi:MAG: formate dehydrogenase subunit alpha [Caldiserica bacterium]|jgi:formate dehydrogenase alpha subunit|nr:formate dehydrogenase subunit alpha [Caldisericota bacterium]